MVAVRKPLTNRRGSKKFEPSDLFRVVQRGLLEDRVWDKIGIVVVPDGESSHFRKITDATGKILDVLVDVETVPDGQDLTCRLTSVAGGPGIGLWRIPSEGAEVGISLGDGKIDFMPRIVSVLSTGHVPARVSDERTILVADDEIEVIVGDCILRVKPSEIQLGGLAVERIIKGTSFTVALDTMLLGLSIAFASLAAASTGPLLPLAAGFTAAKAAIDSFRTAAATADYYLSTKSKTE